MTTTNIFYPENIAPLTSFDKASAASSLKDALIDGSILTGIVNTCDQDENLILDLGGIRGIIPRDEFDFLPLGKHTPAIARIRQVDKNTCFKVIRFDTDENGDAIAILSRREAQKECFENYVNSFKRGDTIGACVTSISPVGVFADVGCGIEALIPQKYLSYSYDCPHSVPFNVGDNICADVIKINKNTHKICLSTKTLLATWQENADQFNVGDTVTGTICNKIKHGWLVDLASGFSGYIDEYENLELSVGKKVEVVIKSKNRAKQKVKLWIANCLDDNTCLPIDFSKHYVLQSNNFYKRDDSALTVGDCSDTEAS
jgi:small subunit ribosomal protein S1